MLTINKILVLTTTVCLSIWLFGVFEDVIWSLLFNKIVTASNKNLLDSLNLTFWIVLIGVLTTLVFIPKESKQ